MGYTYLIISSIIFALVIGILIYQSQGLKRQYDRELFECLSSTEAGDEEVLSKEDIVHLPEPVQRYLAYVGVIGKEKLHDVRINFDGKMKMNQKKNVWSNVKAEQYNSFKDHRRIFYMKGNIAGLPYCGLHSYGNGSASMLVKILGLIPVVDVKGEDMLKAETVTVLNDMCLFAPAALIDRRITWVTIDSLTVKAVFKNNGYTVSGTLCFNEEGQLVNFISDDRYKLEDDGSLKKARWATPIKHYKPINGFNLPGEPDNIDTREVSGATWYLPEGEYCYVKLKITGIKYNCR